MDNAISMFPSAVRDPQYTFTPHDPGDPLDHVRATISGKGLPPMSPPPESRRRYQMALRQFEAAQNKNTLFDWGTQSITCDADLYRALPELRARAKDLAQNNHYVKRFLRLLETNVIGPEGIKLQMAVKNSDGTKDKMANDLLEQAWDEFSQKENFTVTGQLDRTAAECLAIKSLAREGEIIIRVVKGYDNPHRFAIQFIDVSQLDHEYNARLEDGGFVRMGVEFDRWRRPRRYHFLTYKDADDMFLASSTIRRERFSVPADQIIHRYIHDYIDQSRGYTWFHAAMIQLRHLGSYQEAAIIASRIGASKMGIWTPQPDAATGEFSGDDVDDDGNLIMEATPGGFEIAPKGYKLDMFDPGYPNTDHGEFVKAMLKGISSGLNVCYPSLASDLEGVNYSSIRAGLLEDRDGYKLLHNFFIQQIEKDIFRHWLSSALMAAKTLTPLPAAKFDKFNAPKFAGRSWPWVDPLKDIQAEVQAINARLKSRKRVMTQQGIEFDDEVQQIQDEESLFGGPEGAPALGEPQDVGDEGA